MKTIKSFKFYFIKFCYYYGKPYFIKQLMKNYIQEKDIEINMMKLLLGQLVAMIFKTIQAIAI